MNKYGEYLVLRYYYGESHSERKIAQYLGYHQGRYATIYSERDKGDYLISAQRDGLKEVGSATVSGSNSVSIHPRPD